ncbi:MAG: cytochrome ubiquinol oxidase subunit I [Oligoflexia bacterium]|nr:cytochrome ubiquinol oxidase subunit I [Oligoflexia bacterium]
MTELLAARYQMALSLGFHIIFAAIGVAMPFLMAAAHWLYLRRGDSDYRILTKAWSKGVAIFFAVGAVSGTALSFELGLLWPRFMEHAGPIIGMPFSWEGTAFFLEAIALGIFLYGWDRVRPWIHWGSGLVVGLSGVTSAFFVICANGWMNSPAGFDWNNGNPINIDPWAAMFNEAAFLQGLHMVVAAFEAVGFAVAGVHAILFLRTRYRLHARALKIAFVFGALAALANPVVGDFSAKSVARHQPVKLAAMEGLYETTRGAPLLIGGIPDEVAEKTDYAIELPGFLSFLAYGDFKAEVKGLKEVPRDERPPVLITHFAFQVMVGLGSLLALVGSLGLFFLWKRPEEFESRRMLLTLALCLPFGFIALEAGWIVTEVGRQPWIIYGILRTAEALTPRPGVVYTLIMYALLYGFLSFVVTMLMIRQTLGLHRQLREEGR